VTAEKSSVFTEKLPVDEFLPEIERLLAKHPVLILTAETGAGKSTRVPFHFWQKGLKVSVTQPRRIAARALSQYLAQKAALPWGGKIGYQTGFESRFSSATKLLFLTDGVQLQKEMRKPQDCDLLVLDEIHEWNLNQEILLGLVKKKLENGFLIKNGKRVAVMSATLKAAQLSAFLDNAPVVSIPGRGFPVAGHHRQSSFLLPDTAALVEEGKNILVFQPGKQEIEKFTVDLKAMLGSRQGKTIILPLHSELPPAEQGKVFRRYNRPKVVVATDIAQTSLTIEDIDVVVDDGTKKEVRVINGIEGLYPVNISRSECLQRAGRAGRVRSGTYILCAELDVNDREAFPEPEIRRLNLESVVLRQLKWGIDPLTFPSFHRPRKKLVISALHKLKVFGALDEQNRVTPAGERMAELPVSIRAARLLIESEKGGPAVVDKALKIIALLECKGVAGPEYRGEKLYSEAWRSDLLNHLSLWETGRRLRGFLSAKKSAQAGLVYRELQRRLALKTRSRDLDPREKTLLFRAVVSAFADGVFRKCESLYCREGEAREVDRHSVLRDNSPELLVGLPFDLVVRHNRDWPQRVEESKLPLLTFCSEISLGILEELKPFGFEKTNSIEIKSGRIVFRDHYYFGRQEIETRARMPRWQDKSEAIPVVEKVLDWLAAQGEHSPLAQVEARLQACFYDALPLLPKINDSYRQLLRRAWRRKLLTHLRTDDLNLFLPFHQEFKVLTLADLLPRKAILALRAGNWPGCLRIAGAEIPVRYQQGRPYLICDLESFRLVTKADTLLPTGDSAGIDLSGRLFTSWQAALNQCNEELRLQIFNSGFRDHRPVAEMSEIVDLEFPQAVPGGRGLHNTSFEFHAIPRPGRHQVQLEFFLNPEEAARAFSESLQDWREACRLFKQKALGDMFRAKGWKVR